MHGTGGASAQRTCSSALADSQRRQLRRSAALGLAPRFPCAALTELLCCAQAIPPVLPSSCITLHLLTPTRCAGRGEKRSRPPSPSRPDRPDPSTDRGGPRAEPMANGRPLPDDRRGAKRLAVNLLPEAGSAPPRDADKESDRKNDRPKRSRSPQDARPAEPGASGAGPPGLSPSSSRGPSPAAGAAQTRPRAAAGKNSANGNTATAEVGGGDPAHRGTSPPSASGVPAESALLQNGVRISTTPCLHVYASPMIITIYTLCQDAPCGPLLRIMRAAFWGDAMLSTSLSHGSVPYFRCAGEPPAPR